MDELARYFNILEVRRGASLEEVKHAYRDLAQVWHPDRYGHNPRLRAKAEEKLKAINEAYQSLSAYFQSSSKHTPPPQKNSPPPASNASAAHTGRTESREQKPPPTSPPPPSASKEANVPPAFVQPANNTGCIVTAFIVVGMIILVASSKHSNRTQYTPVQTQYRPPLQSSPAPPPQSTPSPQPITAAEQTELAQMKSQIEDRVVRKDAEFDRLQKWYQQGVTAQDESSYRASLERAQQEEQAIEALILSYNTKKKELDAKNLAK